MDDLQVVLCVNICWCVLMIHHPTGVQRIQSAWFQCCFTPILLSFLFFFFFKRNWSEFNSFFFTAKFYTCNVFKHINFHFIIKKNCKNCIILRFDSSFHIQARKEDSGTTRLDYSLLVKAGEALAPDDFILVLDSENEVKGNSLVTVELKR